MVVVVDTSAAAEITLQRQHADAFAQHVTDAGWVIAPYLYIAEITNVYWKYHVYQDLPLSVCETGIRQAIALPDDYFRETELAQESFALGCQTRMPVYDMFFLALARRHNAYLLTLDEKLKKTARKVSIRAL